MLMDWLTASGLAGLKPVLTALVLPPLPLIVLALAGAWGARARPGAGRALALLACAGLWFTSCTGTSAWVERRFLPEPAALDAGARAALKARAGAGASMAIVVLGGGVEDFAPEYGRSSLAPIPLSRLRYGIWLARQTGIPLGISGGRGWGGSDAVPAEADLMAAIARDEFGQPVRWIEPNSRDTRENATNTMALLRAAGVSEVLVVTTGWHLPRALREFQRAADATAAGGTANTPGMQVVGAPTGQAYPADRALLRWLPSGDGALRMRSVLREVLGSSVGTHL